MTNWLNRLKITAWPIWVKLLVGFVLAVAIPLLLLMALTVNTVQQIGTENTRIFVEETGTRQARAITTAFAQGRAQLNSFINDDNQFIQIRNVLPLSTPDLPEPAVNRNAIFNLAISMQNNLLLSNNSLYDQINLIDPGGQLILRAQRQGVIAGGANLVDTASYRQATQARLRGESQVFSIDFSQVNQPVLEIINVLSIYVSGTSEPVVIGYLIARMDPSATIFDNLPVSRNFLDTNSRLVTRAGLVIDAEGVSVPDNLNISTTLLDQALDGDAQIEVINTSAGARVRYYTPITETPFVLVTEGAADAMSNQIIDFIMERGFALVLGIIFLVAVLVILANQLLSTPIQRITHAIQAVTRGNYNASLPDVQRGDEIGELAGSVADMRKRILDLVTDLEQRIETRARDITTTREISHAAATQRDVQQLMEQVVNLIVQRFANIYHAQVFLIDRDQRFAILRASTGDAGRHLLARGHRLAVGSNSVVGRATETGDMVVARDVASSRLHRHNDLLPDTLTELAIPLRVGDRIIGVLDVQSTQSDAFDDEQMNVLQTMADQVAVAIENARLYTESLRQLEEIERGRRTSTLQAWHDYMDTLRTRQLESAAGILPASGFHDDLRQSALERGQVVVGKLTAQRTIPIAVPISLRGQLLGTVEWEVPQNEFDHNKVQLAQDLTDRLAVNLEKARLFQESQRTTQRERLVNEISSRLTTPNDIDQILQTAVREVGMALRAPHVSIRVNPQTNGHSKNGHSNGQGDQA